MTTIYNKNDLRMELDEDAVVIYNFGIQLLEATRDEFEQIIKAYQEVSDV